jgi:PAS domain S-box-containing protein
MNAERKPLVVVVDDNPATVYATGRILETGGYVVERAVTGQDALKIIDENVDIVILDVNLPDIDGFEVCRRIRGNPLTEHIGIIHLSATNVGDADRIEGLDAGADTYLTHPIAPPVLLATVRTVQRLRNAEGAVQRSDEKFRAIFEHAPIGIVLLNHKLEVGDLNPQMCSLLGRPAAAVQGRSLADFVEEDDLGFYNDLSHHVLGAREWKGLLRVKRPDGSSPELEWHISSRLEMGQALGIVTDVSARQSLEIERERLYALERLARTEAERLGQVKDEFLATLAHELRNPLAPLRNALHIMQMPNADSNTLARMREIMDRQVTQMAHLIDDLMDVSRITRGLVELKKQPVTLESILHAAIEISSPLIEQRKQQLRVSLPTERVVITVDPVRGAQIFANLLNNAAKYTPTDGHIDVEALMQGDKVIVTIVDSGIGLAPHMTDRIFDMFTQVPQASDRSAGGLGIGLTLVRRLIEMHDGSIVASSEGLNLGSTFTVCLPAIIDDHVPQSHDANKLPMPSSVQSIIVVDDNRDSTESLCELLTLLGYETKAYFDGSEGIEAVLRYRPYLAFIDIGMPKIDGYEVARRIREHDPEHGIQLVAMTGWGLAEDRRRSKDAGFDLHLVKPVGLDDLQLALSAPGHRPNRASPAND